MENLLKEENCRKINEINTRKNGVGMENRLKMENRHENGKCRKINGINTKKKSRYLVNPTKLYAKMQQVMNKKSSQNKKSTYNHDVRTK